MINGFAFKDSIFALRRILIICILWFCLCFGFCLTYNHVIIDIFFNNLKLTSNNNLLFTKNITSGAFIALKTAFYLSLLLLLPVLFGSLYHFASAGLFKKERRFAALVICACLGLGLVGVAFGFFVFAKMFFTFFLGLSLSSHGVQTLIDAEHLIELYISFCIMGFFVFQTPLCVFALLKIGVLKQDVFVKYRRFYIVIYLAIGAIVTPPDVLSQIVVSFTLWILTELGFFAYKITSKPLKH